MRGTHNQLRELTNLQIEHFKSLTSLPNANCILRLRVKDHEKRDYMKAPILASPLNRRNFSTTNPVHVWKLGATRCNQNTSIYAT